jgi:hypothetical protein
LNTKNDNQFIACSGTKQEINNKDDQPSLQTFFALPPKALNRVVNGRSPGLLLFFRLPKLGQNADAQKHTNASTNNSVACDSEKRLNTKLTVAGTAPDLSNALTGVPF